MREWFQRGRWVTPAGLARAVAESDLIFGWFASWHTLFPVLLAQILGRPSVLAVGGYDSANLPAINYGNMRGGFKQWVTGTAMKHSSKLVPFSQFSRREILEHTNLPEERLECVYLGIPLTNAPSARKEQLVITVGNVTRENLRRKGLEAFVRAAACLPDTPFVVIGAWQDDSIHELKRLASPNVQFTGRVDDTRLHEYFARARVYVQPSLHEGFGMAVAEAMLHRCVPVVTRAGALPEVVGDTGVYVDSTEAPVLANAVRHALALDDSWGDRARERIVREFPLARRQERLYQIVDACLAA